MFLSIIIPVYKTEKYLRKCLNSCVHQNINEYEIIIVDDGSPDNSLSIAKEYALSYNNIKIVSQTNAGLSAARNIGLNNACGNYVWFVDSDDWIEENCLGRICSLLKSGVDILQLQYRKVYEKDYYNLEIPFYIINGIKSGKEIIFSGGLPTPAQFSIYRTEFLRNNNLKFYEGILHEDSEFKPRATYLANSISSDTDVSYNYLQRESGSITSTYKLKNATSTIIAMNNILRFVQDYNVEKNLRCRFYRIMGMNMNSLLIGYHQLELNDKNHIRKLLKSNKHLFVCMMKSGSLKYMIEGFIFYFNPYVGFSFHKLLR